MSDPETLAVYNRQADDYVACGGDGGYWGETELETWRPL